MDFYSISLSNVTPVKLVTAKANYGIGFLTAFVGSFCSLFGIPNNMFTQKLKKAETLAMEELTANAKAVGADGVMDVRCQIDGLSFLVSGTAYKLSPEEKAKCDAEEKVKREAEEKAKREVEEKNTQNEKYLDDDEILYDQHVCSSEDELKKYIEKVLDEKSRPKELLDLYWQYKKYIYGYYPDNETKLALEKVIKKCQSNAYEGNSQLMITVCETKLSKL
jgi:uncharacterized protein YbjQ (UPF0145 family)